VRICARFTRGAEVQLVEADDRLAVGAGIGCPQRDLTGPPVDQSPVFAVGLGGQRVADLLQIQAARPKHEARMDLLLPPRPGGERAVGGMRTS
jgi:hypothetical protein